MECGYSKDLECLFEVTTVARSRNTTHLRYYADPNFGQTVSVLFCSREGE
jgi:hypothetical protein